MQLSESFSQFLAENGANLVDFADIQSEPAEVREGLPLGVSIVVALDRAAVAGIIEGPVEGHGPTLEYLREYERVNRLLSELAEKGAAWLRQQGYRAEPLAATVDKVDEYSLFTRLPHKTIATRAGLGWIGKTALLITKQYGAAFRMSSILTDAPLAVGVAQNESLCGKCTACVDACPVGAASGKNWQVGMSREELFDAVACYHNALAMGRAIGNTKPSVICGICVAVCPHTRRYVGVD